MEGGTVEGLEAPTGRPEADQEDLRGDYKGKDEVVVERGDHQDGKVDDWGCIRVAEEYTEAGVGVLGHDHGSLQDEVREDEEVCVGPLVDVMGQVEVVDYGDRACQIHVMPHKKVICGAWSIKKLKHKKCTYVFGSAGSGSVQKYS